MTTSTGHLSVATTGAIRAFISTEDTGLSQAATIAATIIVRLVIVLIVELSDMMRAWRDVGNTSISIGNRRRGVQEEGGGGGRLTENVVEMVEVNHIQLLQTPAYNQHAMPLIPNHCFLSPSFPRFPSPFPFPSLSLSPSHAQLQ